jgi:type I restriction enzyme S subunit
MKELKIKEICTKGSSSLKQKDVEGHTGKYPVYGASGIVGYRDTYDQENEYIGLVKDGSGIGRVMFLPAHSSIIGTLQYILPKHGYDINYIGYCLQSLDLSSYKQGAAIPHIYFRDYGERLVSVESDPKAQKAIVEKLDTLYERIDKQKNAVIQAYNDAKALFEASLHEAMDSISGCKMQKVGKAFDSHSGATPPKAHKEYYDGGNIPWLVSGEVCKKYITETANYITKLGMDNTSAKYHPIDSVMIAMYGANAAQVGILKIKATSNQAVCGLQPRKEYYPEFVYYWFLHKQNYLAGQAQGGAQPNISQVKIKNMDIPIIGKDVQLQIIKKLDDISERVDAMKTNYKTIEKDCELLKMAALHEIFE